MTQHEQDEKEFEELWLQNTHRDDLETQYGNIKNWCREYFLASRRLLRKQLGKCHNVDEFYKEEEEKSNG